MISKLCASWLVVLVLSPFTAPFSTCDLTNPIRHTGRGGPFVPQFMATDTNAALMPARVMARALKLVGRVGHLERTGPSSSVNVALFADSVAVVQRRHARHTILRL
jgi:hypothetical protein